MRSIMPRSNAGRRLTQPCSSAIPGCTGESVQATIVSTIQRGKFFFLIDPVSVSLSLTDRHPCTVPPSGEELMNRPSSWFAAALLVLACVLSVVPGVAQPAQTPIKIGFGMALTGGLAAGGKQALVTYQLWAEEVNARGGLLGRKVELVYYDDQSNPATVPAIYSK